MMDSVSNLERHQLTCVRMFTVYAFETYNWIDVIKHDMSDGDTIDAQLEQVSAATLLGGVAILIIYSIPS